MPQTRPALAATFAVALAAGLAACQTSQAEPDVDAAAVRSALDACMQERVADGLGRLDSLLALAPGHADVLATRGLCRAVRFAADSVQADARAAFADLSAAIDGVTAAPDAFATPLGQLYNQRAFVVRAMRPDDWPAAIADLGRAVEADPRNAVFVLDRGVARALSGDTTAARTDLRLFERLAPGDTARARALRDLLASPRGTPAVRG